MKLIRYAEQPELWANSVEITYEVHTAPCHWDGTPDGLGERIDAMAEWHATLTSPT
jgi:hypothetical protein